MNKETATELKNSLERIVEELESQIKNINFFIYQHTQRIRELELKIKED